jgi:hypothetical protein
MDEEYGEVRIGTGSCGARLDKPVATREIVCTAEDQAGAFSSR